MTHWCVFFLQATVFELVFLQGFCNIRLRAYVYIAIGSNLQIHSKVRVGVVQLVLKKKVLLNHRHVLFGFFTDAYKVVYLSCYVNIAVMVCAFLDPEIRICPGRFETQFNQCICQKIMEASACKCYPIECALYYHALSTLVPKFWTIFGP